MTVKVQTAIGAPPKLEWVDVNLIDVDQNYQRHLDGNKVEKMLGEFHWDHFGAVVLAAQPSGRFTVTDGQHRVKVARLHPAIEKIPATIISRQGTAAEAENFLKINRNRKAVTPIEKHWAGVAAEDPRVLRVQKVLSSAGCEVAPDSGTYKPHMTNAVGAIDRAVELYGDKAVRRALLTIRDAWPSNNKALRGSMITALARILEMNPDLDDARLVKVLRPKSYAEMTAHAEGFRKLSGGSADTALARTITELYNRGISANTIYFGAQK